MTGTIIRERRQLLMPLQTVLDAVVQFDRLSGGSLSRGDVVGAEFVRNSAAGDGLHVAVIGAEDSVIEWRQFDMDAISAAIIVYCRSKRIPLPFNAAKSVILTDDGAAFSIENEVQVTRRESTRQDLSGRPLRYAKGYEPHALAPRTRPVTAV